MQRHLILRPPINSLHHINLPSIRPIRSAQPERRPGSAAGGEVGDIEDDEGGEGYEAVGVDADGGAAAVEGEVGPLFADRDG